MNQNNPANDSNQPMIDQANNQPLNQVNNQLDQQPPQINPRINQPPKGFLLQTYPNMAQYQKPVEKYLAVEEEAVRPQPQVQATTQKIQEPPAPPPPVEEKEAEVAVFQQSSLTTPASISQNTAPEDATVTIGAGPQPSPPVFSQSVSSNQEPIAINPNQNFQPRSTQPSVTTDQSASGLGFIFKSLLGLLILLIILFAGYYLWQEYQKGRFSNLQEMIGQIIKVQPTPVPTFSPPPRPVTVEQTQYTQLENLPTASNTLSLNVFNYLALQSEDNIVLSSPNLMLALAILNNATAGQTQQEIAQTTNVSGMSLDSLNQASAQMIARMGNLNENQQVQLGHALWLPLDTQLNEDFLKTNQQYFAMTINYLDFSNTESNQKIQNWLTENLLANQSFQLNLTNADTNLLLTNTASFQTIWTYAFNSKNNQQKVFHLASGQSKQMSFLNAFREDYQYLETDIFQAINLPLGQSKKVAFYAFLPKNDLDSLINSLTLTNLKSWIKLFDKKAGTVYLPKLKFTSSHDLKETLNNLGMNLAFTDQADFSSLTDQQLRLSQIQQLNYFEMSETGIDLQSLTNSYSDKVLGAIKSNSPPENFELIFDKSFVFMVINNDNEEIIYLALIRNPSYDSN